MGGRLQVNPEHLRSAATAQTDVGRYVTDMQPGAPVTNAGGDMAGLQTEGACQFVAAVFDSAAGVVGAELTDHSEKLTTAATHYGQVDDDFGRRLRAFGQ